MYILFNIRGADNGVDDMDDSDSDQFEGVHALGDSVLKLWKDRAKIIESDFTICEWYICVFYRVMDDGRCT
jgi:hypothetical protein